MLKIWPVLAILFIAFSVATVSAAREQVTVSAQDSETLRFYLEDGDRIKYWISVSGGKNDDVDIIVKNPNGGIMNEGRIYSSFNDEFRASQNGNYYFEFENDFSLISKKYVTFDYEIIKKPIPIPSASSIVGSNFAVGFGWIWLIILGLIIGIPIAVWKRRKNSNKQDYVEEEEIEDNSPEDNPERSQNENALRILKERLAKGEISKEEYDKLKKEFE